MEGMLSPSPAAGNGGGLADPLLANSGNGMGRAGAISKDKKYWVPVDEEEEVLATAEEDGSKDCRRRPLLYRTFKVKGILLQTYRYVSLVIKLSGVSSDSLHLQYR